jgi:hypothetical protein
VAVFVGVTGRQRMEEDTVHPCPRMVTDQAPQWVMAIAPLRQVPIPRQFRQAGTHSLTISMGEPIPTMVVCPMGLPIQQGSRVGTDARCGDAYVCRTME